MTTWTVNSYPDPARNGLFKVIAFTNETRVSDRRVIHRDKLTAEQVAAFDPDAEWGGRRPPVVVDLMARIAAQAAPGR